MYWYNIIHACIYDSYGMYSTNSKTDNNAQQGPGKEKKEKEKHKRPFFTRLVGGVCVVGRENKHREYRLDR